MHANKDNNIRPIILHTEVLIRFSDCDPFNHLNNSRYIDYFLNTREDQLLQFYHFDLFAHAQATGCGWVVGQHTIAYLKPALTNETVVIESTIVKWNDKNVLVEFRMWNKAKTKLKSLMWTTFYYFNLTTQKSEMHTEEMNQRFKLLENPELHAHSFDKRLIHFKTK